MLQRRKQHDVANDEADETTLALPLIVKENTTTQWNKIAETRTTTRTSGNFITLVRVSLFLAMMILSFVQMMSTPLARLNSDGGTLSISGSSGGSEILLLPATKTQMKRTKEEATSTTTNTETTPTATTTITTLPPPNVSTREFVTTTPIITTTTTTSATTAPPRFHLVLSTGCSAGQNWQSFVSLYHLVKSGQTGDVTRIASGCTMEEEKAVQQWFHQEVQQLLHHFQEEEEEAPSMARGSSSSSSRSSLRFHLHLTPDYSNARPGHSYVYFNKAFGMKHWMEHGLGYNSIHDKYRDDDTTTTTTRTREPNEHDNTIIILLDPDQLVLKPFTHNYTDAKHMGWVRRADEKENSVVQRGTSIAQL
jgi:hypothetical protein